MSKMMKVKKKQKDKRNWRELINLMDGNNHGSYLFYGHEYHPSKKLRPENSECQGSSGYVVDDLTQNQRSSRRRKQTVETSKDARANVISKGQTNVRLIPQQPRRILRQRSCVVRSEIIVNEDQSKVSSGSKNLKTMKEKANIASNLPEKANASKQLQVKLLRKDPKISSLTSSQKKSLLGFLFWGKFGKRFWPCMSIKFPGKEKENHRWVFWYGDHKISQIHKDKLEGFVANFRSLYEKSYSNKFYVKAIDEILLECCQRENTMLAEHIGIEHRIVWARYGFPGNTPERPKRECLPNPDKPIPDFVKSHLKMLKVPEDEGEVGKDIKDPKDTDQHSNACYGCYNRKKGIGQNPTYEGLHVPFKVKPLVRSQKPIRVLTLGDSGYSKMILENLGLKIEGFYSCTYNRDVTFKNGEAGVIDLGSIFELSLNKIEEICPIDLVLGKFPTEVFKSDNDKGIFDFEFYRVLCEIGKRQEWHVFWLYEALSSDLPDVSDLWRRFLKVSYAKWDSNKSGSNFYYIWGNIPGLYCNYQDMEQVENLGPKDSSVPIVRHILKPLQKHYS